MTETLAHWYSSESTQQELFNEYHHDRVYMVLKNLCILVLWTKVASALKGLRKWVNLMKYLNDRSVSSAGKQSIFKCFQNIALFEKIFPKIIRPPANL